MAWISVNSSPETSMLTAAPVGGPPWSCVIVRSTPGRPVRLSRMRWMVSDDGSARWS